MGDLEDCISELRPGAFRNGFENSMFTGEYLTSDDLIEGDPGVRVEVCSGKAGIGALNGGGDGGSMAGGGLGGSGGAVVDVI